LNHIPPKKKTPREHIPLPKEIKSDVGNMTANGFKMQYDRIFEGCDASTQHLTLWMKEGRHDPAYEPSVALRWGSRRAAKNSQSILRAWQRSEGGGLLA
jgi:hypothetical protein